MYVDLLLNVLIIIFNTEEIYDYKINIELIIFNHLKLLEKNKNIENFFKILNICIDKFIWKYLWFLYFVYKKIFWIKKKFLNMKIKFIQEIFNDCLENKNFNNNIINKEISYLLYSKFEENYGMLNNWIEILLKFIKNPKHEKIEIFSF